MSKINLDEMKERPESWAEQNSFDSTCRKFYKYLEEALRDVVDTLSDYE